MDTCVVFFLLFDSRVFDYTYFFIEISSPNSRLTKSKKKEHRKLSPCLKFVFRWSCKCKYLLFWRVKNNVDLINIFQLREVARMRRCAREGYLTTHKKLKKRHIRDHEQLIVSKYYRVVLIDHSSWLFPIYPEIVFTCRHISHIVFLSGSLVIAMIQVR